MRRTRIIATIGPASEERSLLTQLMESGVDVCRLNYSHGEPETKTELYQRIRSIEDELGRPTCILADLPGPKLRLGSFPGVVMLEAGSTVELVCGLNEMESTDGSALPVQYGGLSAELKPNDPILIADGLIRMVVVQTPGTPNSTVTCRVEDGGPVSSRKGVNVPGHWLNCQRLGLRTRKQWPMLLNKVLTTLQ
jgi:pyruvate kinase